MLWVIAALYALSAAVFYGRLVRTAPWEHDFLLLAPAPRRPRMPPRRRPALPRPGPTR